MSHKFEIGDVVVKCGGRRPMRVIAQWGSSRYRTKYLHSGQTVVCYENELKIYEGDEIVNKDGLYSVVTAEGHEKIAVKIGVNSNNQWIMEEKGTGNILIVNESAVTEILPYTVEVCFLNGNKTSTSFIVNPHSLETGDMVITDAGAFGVVTKVDNKSKSARKGKLRKLLTEKVY